MPTSTREALLAVIQRLSFDTYAWRNLLGSSAELWFIGDDERLTAAELATLEESGDGYYISAMVAMIEGDEELTRIEVKGYNSPGPRVGILRHFQWLLAHNLERDTDVEDVDFRLVICDNRIDIDVVAIYVDYVDSEGEPEHYAPTVGQFSYHPERDSITVR